MILAIMQPYFFPYIGYFQLIAAADAFVFLDDAQYSKGGWLARNRIAIKDRTHWWTRPVRRDAPLTARIRDRRFSRDGDAHLVAQLSSAYGASGTGMQVVDKVRGWLDTLGDNVAGFNKATLVAISEELGCAKRWHDASAIPNPDGLRGQDRVISICRALGASHYVNAIGGTGLYHDEAFADSGIRLSFVKCTASPEAAPAGAGLLSIVHELAVRGTEATRERLGQFRLCDRTEALECAG